MRMIASNAGQDGAVVIETVRASAQEKASSTPATMCCATSTWIWWKRGIIDPAKVTRSAVENAACIAAMILTTDALVTDIPEPEKAAPMGGGGGMGMDM